MVSFVALRLSTKPCDLRIQAVRRAIDSLDRLLVRLTINKNEACGIKLAPTFEPVFTSAHQTWLFLLQCMCGLF